MLMWTVPPWLIKRFTDVDAEFVFASKHDVMNIIAVEDADTLRRAKRRT